MQKQGLKNLYIFVVMPESCSVAKWDDSLVITSGSLDLVSFENMNGKIVGVYLFSSSMFAPESKISIVYFLG